MVHHVKLVYTYAQYYLPTIANHFGYGKVIELLPEKNLCWFLELQFYGVMCPIEQWPICVAWKQGNHESNNMGNLMNRSGWLSPLA